jgi:hypothetical protein
MTPSDRAASNTRLARTSATARSLAHRRRCHDGTFLCLLEQASDVEAAFE